MTCDDVTPLLFADAGSDPRVAAHLAGCAGCRDRAPALAAVARALAAAPEPAVPAGLDTAVLRAAAPLLARPARRAAGWRLARALGAALLPLPLIVFLDVGLLTAAYHLLSMVLPHGLSLYLVANHAALIALLLALTYGSIPLLAARQGPVCRGEPWLTLPPDAVPTVPKRSGPKHASAAIAAASSTGDRPSPAAGTARARDE